MSVRVFLADDHQLVRDGLKLLLEADPDICVAGEAADGRSAVRLVKGLRPDVVILDVAMPEMNGIDAAEIIHREVPDTAIIVLSMYSTKEHIFRALRAGASGYLLKESAAVEVVSAVREVQCGRRYLSTRVSDEVIDAFIHPNQGADVETPLEMLSSRERQILQLVGEGKTSAQIGEILFLSPKTVDTYRSRVMAKLDVHDIAGLVRFAIQHGLLSLES